jgi:anionic cell wall polymer biosynthesis LytR-Cps2A-Psr (LCP) family protein
MGYGGFPLLVSTFEKNFAIHVDHYIMTNFDGFKKIVDTLGGITIDAAQNTADSCDLSYAEHSWCSVGPGSLSGWREGTLVRALSLHFRRLRPHAPRTGSHDRDFKQLMTFGAVSKAPQLYNEFSSSIETDMSLSDFLQFLTIAPTVISDTSRIQRYEIGTSQVIPYTIPYSGAYVLKPNYNAIWDVIKEAVYTP